MRAYVKLLTKLYNQNKEEICEKLFEFAYFVFDELINLTNQ